MFQKLFQPKNLAQQRDHMVRWQLQGRAIGDQQVLRIMARLPREQFVPEPWRHAAYEDRALPIGLEQTISQPYMVALMTESLQVCAEHRVLEVGTGSGYQTAILASLAAEVYTVERLAGLADRAKRLLEQMDIRNVHYRIGDGTEGWAEPAPYDRIIATAAAPEIPQPLINQLREGGILVIPTGPEDCQTLIKAVKQDGKLTTTAIVACRFVKLLGRHAWREE